MPVFCFGYSVVAEAPQLFAPPALAAGRPPSVEGEVAGVTDRSAGGANNCGTSATAMYPKQNTGIATLYAGELLSVK